MKIRVSDRTTIKSRDNCEIMFFSFFFGESWRGRVRCKEEGRIEREELGCVYTRGITKTNPPFSAFCALFFKAFFLSFYPYSHLKLSVSIHGCSIVVAMVHLGSKTRSKSITKMSIHSVAWHLPPQTIIIQVPRTVKIANAVPMFGRIQCMVNQSSRHKDEVASIPCQLWSCLSKY